MKKKYGETDNKRKRAKKNVKVTNLLKLRFFCIKSNFLLNNLFESHQTCIINSKVKCNVPGISFPPIAKSRNGSCSTDDWGFCLKNWDLSKGQESSPMPGTDDQESMAMYLRYRIHFRRRTQDVNFLLAEYSAGKSMA